VPKKSQAAKPKPLYKIRRRLPQPPSERGVHAASATATQQVTRNSSHSNVRAVRRPEGRAPDTLHDTQLPLRTVATDTPIEAQPFLKWVGGKGQLLGQLDAFFPATVTRYFEPFVGGGAVFFHLQHRFPRLRAFLRDINPELINTYRAVRDRPRELMRRLDQHAAEFNVPVGSYKNPRLYDEENLWAASLALEGVHLEVQDFRRTFGETRRDDFIYVDPPYHPASPTASFTSYAKEEFGEGEQRELHARFADAARRGVRVMLSNSDTPFIRNLYGDFPIHTVQARGN